MAINPDMRPRPAMTCCSPAIVGSAEQADAQGEGGQAAYQQSLIRNQQAQAETKRLEDMVVELDLHELLAHLESEHDAPVTQ